MKALVVTLTVTSVFTGLALAMLIAIGGGTRAQETRQEAPARSAVRAADRSVWRTAEPVRPGAGGLEAERDTWVRTPRRLEVVSARDGQSWPVQVSGDARPTMRRLRIEALSGRIDTPFLLSGHSYDFRSAERLVASVTRGAKTEEERALALRELLIGEGFYFHFKPPPMMDPIHRLTNAGYGFCGQHAQIFEALAKISGLRVSTCGHPFGYGHATNQVFYDGQWHFVDTDGEALFRRADGVIPSYEDIRRTPNLVPSGDAYGQTSFGIDGARYARALYASETTCIERTVSTDTSYGELRYALRAGDSITWEWEDASFSLNRQNRTPTFGRGILSTRLQRADFRIADGQMRRRVPLAYPPLEVRLSARRATNDGDDLRIRISKDGGQSWIELTPAAPPASGRSVWRAVIPDPDAWRERSEHHETTNRARTVRAGQYGYLLDISVRRRGSVTASASLPALRDLRLETVFRQYPPALPSLALGANRVTYVDDGRQQGKVRITLEWDERKRMPSLSPEPSAWHWGNTIPLTSGDSAALPTLASGRDGTLHVVYASGQPGRQRVALRTYGAGTWSNETLVTPLTQDANHPVAAEDVNGTVWIAYQTGGLWEGGDVWVVAVRDGQPAEPVRMNTTDPYHVAFFPSVAVSGTRVTVAWEGGGIDRDETSAWGTEVGWLRTFDGRGWNEPELVKGEPFTNLGLPKVFYDLRRRLHLTGTKGPRYYRTLAPARGPFQWLSPEWVYHSRGGSFTSDAKGSVWAVFDGQGSGTTNEIYARMLPASATDTTIHAWTPAIRISEDDKRPSIYPDLIAEDPSRVTVVWMDYRRGNAEIYAKTFEQGRWSPDLRLSAAVDATSVRAAATLTPNELLTRPAQGRQAGYPRIGSAGDGTTWVVWEESVDGVSRAIYACPRLAR